MATVAFDYKGASYEVDVDDSFFEKSPEQQQAAILGRIGGGSKPSAPAAPDTSLRSAIEYGRANVEAGGQATNRVLGLGNPDAKPAEGPANYDPASPKVIEGVREGDVGKALGYLPRAAVENAPDLAGGMAAGAVGAGIGGVFGSVVPGAGTAAGMWLGGLAGSGLYSLYRSFGQNVEGRAENNGHVDEKGRAQPTTGDYVAGGLTSAATSALDAVGARGLGRAAGKAMSATGRLGDVPLSALGRARQAGTAVAREGGTETAQSLVEQTGQTLGTEKGLSVDPAQALGEGLIGLGTGAGVKAAHGAVDAAGATVGAAKDGAVALARRPLEKAAAEALNAGDVEQAKSIVRVTDAAQRWAENTTGREATLDEHMNGMREEITKSLQNTLHLAEREQGWVSEEQARKLRGVLETAARHNKSLAVGEAPADLDTDPHSRPAYGLQLVQEMNAPEAVKQQLSDGLRDLDNLAFGARKKNLRGPLESLFGNLGGAAAIGAAGYFGGPTAAIGTGLALGAGAQPVARKLGEKIGRRIDRAAGISEPTLQLARRQALKTLGDQSPGEDTLVSLARLQEQLTDPSLEVPKTADQIRESQHFLNLAKRRWDSNLPIDESLPSRLTPEHRQALFDWLTEKQDKILASVGEGNAADLAQNRRELESAEARKQRELDQMAAQAQGPDRRVLSPEQAFEAAERERAQEASPLRIGRDLKRAQQAMAAARAAEEPGVRPEILASELRGWDAQRPTVLKSLDGGSDDPAPKPAPPTQTEMAVDPQALAEAAAMLQATQPQEPAVVAQAKRRRSALAAAQDAMTPPRKPRAKPAAPPPPEPAPEPVQQPASAPASAPAAAPAPAGPGWAGENPPGWINAGVVKFSRENYGRRLTVDDVERTVDVMEEEGALSPSEAARIRDPNGQPTGDELKSITARAFRLKGWSMRDGYAGEDPAVSAGSGPTSVRDMPQWQSARESYQEAAKDAWQFAMQAGDHEAAALAQRFRVQTSSELDGPARVALVEALLAKDPTRADLRRALLEGLVAKYR